MSVNKFRFVSPGVFTNEIDNSRLPRAPDEMGPVIIGRSQRGPILRPVRVESYSDFVEVFGEPIPGGIGGDVWRTGNKTAPTYGAYAARAYLRNAGAVTFVRLGGYEHKNKQANNNDASGGWGFDNAYGLFVVPLSASGTSFLTKAGTVSSASLAAVIYASGSNYGLTGSLLNDSGMSTHALGSLVKSKNSNSIKFDIVVNGEVKTIDFDTSSRTYIRNILNTNPILTNANLIASPEKYFLGETHQTFLKDKLGDELTGSFGGVLVKLATSNTNFANFREQAKVANFVDNDKTGWIVSQDKGRFSDFNKSSDYEPQKLFRVVGLSEGEWNSQNIKISIEDIKLPPNEYVKFGSFTLSVRRMDDTDLSPKYLERFTNLSLDRFSDNYIAKRIGNKYTEWDYDNKLFIEYGEFNNNSKFIRVEMDPAVDESNVPTDSIPFGFWLQTKLIDSSAISCSIGTASAGINFINSGSAGYISSSTSVTASFLLPEIPLLTSTANSPASSFTSVYFGLKTNVGSSKKNNEDIIDVVRTRPYGLINESSAVKTNKLFTLDELSGTVADGKVTVSQPVTWVSGSRVNGSSMTANGNTSAMLYYFNRFTMPLVGGSDGVDITERDPFNRRVLKNKTEYSSYAFNSVKVAIDSVADPEVVECNLMSVPGVDNKSLTGYLLDKCETRGDALAVIDLEGDYIPDEGRDSAVTTAKSRKPSVDQVISNLKDRSINSSYGCSFFPWVLIRDTTNNNTVWVPPSVAALGTFASSQARTELWFAPAGFNRGGLSDGAAGVPVIQTSLRLTSKNRDDLYEANINPIATFPAEGIVIFGQKTLQVTQSALDRINVRRLMIYLKKEVSRMAKVVLFDPNLEVTWKRFTNMVNPFLADVKGRFGLSDYRVVLDSTTTTPDLVDRNIVYAKILLKPTRAIEFIALDFVIAPTGASFDD